MKRFVLMAALLLAAPAFAQAPRELVATNSIRLYPGEAKLFELSRAYSKFHLTDDGVVQVIVDTDQRFTLRAMKPGRVLLSIYDADTLIQRSDVIVAGGLVRIYGTGTVNETKNDFVGYICSETGCGRADPDVDQPETRNTVTRTRRNNRGDIITTTKER